jgi:hypothetical protein
MHFNSEGVRQLSNAFSVSDSLISVPQGCQQQAPTLGWKANAFGVFAKEFWVRLGCSAVLRVFGGLYVFGGSFTAESSEIAEVHRACSQN